MDVKCTVTTIKKRIVNGRDEGGLEAFTGAGNPVSTLPTCANISTENYCSHKAYCMFQTADRLPSSLPSHTQTQQRGHCLYALTYSTGRV